jgi:hypothetical protein
MRECAVSIKDCDQCLQQVLIGSSRCHLSCGPLYKLGVFLVLEMRQESYRVSCDEAAVPIKPTAC